MWINDTQTQNFVSAPCKYFIIVLFNGNVCVSRPSVLLSAVENWSTMNITTLQRSSGVLGRFLQHWLLLKVRLLETQNWPHWVTDGILLCCIQSSSLLPDKGRNVCGRAGRTRIEQTFGWCWGFIQREGLWACFCIPGLTQWQLTWPEATWSQWSHGILKGIWGRGVSPIQVRCTFWILQHLLGLSDDLRSHLWNEVSKAAAGDFLMPWGKYLCEILFHTPDNSSYLQKL